jgi:hypothetical protein
MEQQIDAFVSNHEEVLAVVAVRNGGDSKNVAEPENAKNALSVAAGISGSASSQSEIGSGAPGPTDDGRRKPEIVAPGCRITTAEARTACDLDIAVREDGGECATSWAAPAVAGAAALVREYFEKGFFPPGSEPRGKSCHPTGALVKAMLLNAAVNIREGDPDLYPSNPEGWGRLKIDRVLRFAGPSKEDRNIVVLERPNSQGLRQGEVLSFTVMATNLRATLVWMDPAPSVASSGDLINDLDLIVKDDFGKQYCGNFFDTRNRESFAVPSCENHFDNKNNVEQVVIGKEKDAVASDLSSDGPPSKFTIIVQAQSITAGASFVDPRQGFALVVSGDGLKGGRGFLTSDDCSSVRP